MPVVNVRHKIPEAPRAAARFRGILVLAASLVAAVILRSAEPQSGGWSADLLNQILKTETPAGSGTAATASGEMVLRTYQLAQLRLGEAGRPRTLIALLEKLLPAGSSINSDVPANSLHILTTGSAHKAVWEFLSMIDVADAPAIAAERVIPDDIKAALVKVAETGEQSSRVLSAIDTLSSGFSKELAEIDARQRRQTTRLVAGVAAISILLLSTLAWMLRRRPPPVPADVTNTATAALAVVPDQLVTVLAPVHDKMRSDMLGLLNEVAIKLQAQHNEQQKLVREQQKQLDDARQALADERKQFISEAGTMVVQAVERVDATTTRLARQQDKVTELVQELQNTVRELDDTKDNLRSREIELEQERAKIAALSMLLEEGGSLPPPAVGPVRRNGFDLEDSHNGIAARGSRAAGPESLSVPKSTCMTPDPNPLTLLKPSVQAGSPLPRFQFLPPDHPET